MNPKYLGNPRKTLTPRRSNKHASHKHAPPRQDVSSSSSLLKYNLGFHLKIFVSKSPMDGNLTLDLGCSMKIKKP
jgi:hypothetical protein